MYRIKLRGILEVMDSVAEYTDDPFWNKLKYSGKHVKSGYQDHGAKGRARLTFSLMQSLWRQLPEPVRCAWNFHSKGKPLSGYNVFVMTNHEAVRDGGMLELCIGNGLMKPCCCSATINPEGEISVAFEKGADAEQVSLFIHNTAAKDAGNFIYIKRDAAGGAMPVIMTGFNPLYNYNAYAVASDSVMEKASIVSDSAGFTVTKK